MKVREVGPRDGFQNEPEIIATADKVRLVEMLARTGLSRLEVTSFVRADVIPQLSDGAEVLREAEIPEDVSVSVLIPNERGLENALPLREHFQEVNLFLSATESHNRANVNRSVEESLSGIESVIERALGEGLRCEGVISVSFGCPYEGRVEPETVFAIAERLAAAGASEIGFGDTTGMANPAQVREFFALAFDRLPGVELTAHFHNTRGQGLANALAALEAGVRSFESSFGELGGCPVPKGATGNVASEDLVSMLHEMGYETGIDLEKLVDCAREVQSVLGRPLGSHLLTAGPIDWPASRPELSRRARTRTRRRARCRGSRARSRTSGRGHWGRGRRRSPSAGAAPSWWSSHGSRLAIRPATAATIGVDCEVPAAIR